RLAPLAREDLTREREAVRQLHDVAAERSRIQTRLLSEGHVPVKNTDKPQRVAWQVPRPADHPAGPARSPERPGEPRRGTAPRPGERPTDTRPIDPRREPAPRPGETRPGETRPGERPGTAPRPGETRPGLEPRREPEPRPGTAPRPGETRPGLEPRPGERPG